MPFKTYKFKVYNAPSSNPNRKMQELRTTYQYTPFFAAPPATDSHMGDYDAFDRYQIRNTETGLVDFFPFCKQPGDRQYYDDNCYIECERLIPNWIDETVRKCSAKECILHTPNGNNQILLFYDATISWTDSEGHFHAVQHVDFSYGFKIRDLFAFPDDNTDFFLQDDRMCLGYYPNNWLIPSTTLTFKGTYPIQENAIEYFMTHIFTEIEDVGEDTGDDSEEGGQEGNPDNSSDIIPDSEIPIVDAVRGGLVKIYRLDTTQLRSLANFLYSDPTELIEHLTKLFGEPFNAIISIGLINKFMNGETQTIKMAGISTGVSGVSLASQFMTVDCGTVEIKQYYYNALDYDPYTKISLYLPFIGSVNISTDDVMGKRVQIKYQVDALTGTCVAKLIVNGSVMYSFTGNALSQLPFSAGDAKNIYSSLTGLIAAGTNFATTGGVGALAGVAASGLNVMNSKENISKGGTCATTSGLLNVKKPYLTITRPQQSRPKDFKSFKGYTSNISSKLSDLSGYTEIRYCHLKGIDATKEELDMIESLLQSGIIV